MSITDYNECIEQVSDALYRFASRCTGSKEDGNAVVQKSFDALWHNRANVEFQDARKTLFQTAYRFSIDSYSGKVTEMFSTSIANSSTRVGNNILENSLMHLNKKERALVLLKDYENYSYAQIAELTGLTTDQISTYIQRGRTVFKNYLLSAENSRL